MIGMIGMVLLTSLLAPFPQDFPPYEPYKGTIKPGVTITKENLPQYEEELKKLLPPGRHHWFFELGLKPGRITVPVQEVEFFPPKAGYRKWTERSRGKCSIGDGNELLNWEAGIPFPEPKNALEVGWNCYPEIAHATSAEDMHMKKTVLSLYNRNGKYEKHFAWLHYKKKYRGRTDIPPIPQMPEATGRGILSKESLVVIEPHEVRGFIQLRTRYWNVEDDDDSYAYLPALRRLRRLTGADVCDPMLGSDLPQDDYETWRQKLDGKMEFKLIALRDFLVPATYDERWSEDLARGPCFQINWEIRPCLVLDIITNDPNYMYSRRRLYVDATTEGNWIIWWGENFDQRGRMWRALGVTPVAHLRGTTPDLQKIRGFRNLWGYVITNEITHHYTIAVGDPVFFAIEPKFFNIKTLLRLSR